MLLHRSLRPNQPSVLRVAAITQLVCLLIAGLLTLMGGLPSLTINLVYSLAIGNLSSLLINGGGWLVWVLLMRQPGPKPVPLTQGWVGWHWLGPVVLLGSALGYDGGARIAGWLTGTQHSRLLYGSWAQWGISASFSVLASLAVTWFFYTRAKINVAERQAAEVARLAAETQLKLLESQLEPHMMFNTLANLRALIGVDPERAQQMLDRLIDFLRATLGASRVPLHPLSAEFSRLADYLALMQVRMGRRLQTTLDLPPELAQLPVPPLLLQPLVENAIKHGLEPLRRGGHIHIHAERDGPQLRLCVDDSGQGLHAAQTAQALQTDAATQVSPAQPGGGLARSGFGTTQVRERLRTLYGPQASLQLLDLPSTDAQGQPQTGTRAEVRLPWPA